MKNKSFVAFILFTIVSALLWYLGLQFLFVYNNELSKYNIMVQYFVCNTNKHCAILSNNKTDKIYDYLRLIAFVEW